MKALSYFVKCLFVCVPALLVIEANAVPAPGPSADTRAGLDFWALDRLHMPEYHPSRNLVQNPGFEAGFNYWQWQAHSFTDEPIDFCAISTENPQSGKRALTLRSGMFPAAVASFGIPVEQDQDYTVSFYARGEAGKKQTVSVSVLAHEMAKEFEVSGSGWKRYTWTVKMPKPVLNVAFGNFTKGPQEGWKDTPGMIRWIGPAPESRIYIDSVQLEKGPQATEFTTKPAMAWVTGGQRGNLWEPENNPHALLHILGAPGSAGKATLKASDFLDQETERGTLDYQLDDNGEANLPLPWAAQLPLGVHVIDMSLSQNGYTGRDTSRLTVMRFLKNEHRNKNLFSGHCSFLSEAGKREAEFCTRIGLGSMILFNPASHSVHKTLEENGILHFSSILDDGGGFKAMGWKDCELNPLYLAKPKLYGYKMTPEQLGQVEDLSYQKAKAYPEVKYWKLNNEPLVAPCYGNDTAMSQMIEVLLAARKGVLRANPEAQMVGSDPGDMDPRGGIEFIDHQLTVAGDRKVYEIPAIHPYRQRPESPDLDADTRTYLDMLARHEFTKDVWFTEGIYPIKYNIPEWKLVPFQATAADHWRFGDLSYSMGWQERYAAAFSARNWLVGLKYADRVKLYVDWGILSNSKSGVDMTPGPSAFAPNTLGHILGNATFKTDVDLGFDTRCYVFEDEMKRPVAAVWYYNLESDKGKAPGNVLDVSALTKAFPDIEYADLMGNFHPLKASLPVGPFPIFIRGVKGTSDAFVENLRQASLLNIKGSLRASVSLQSLTQSIIRVDNSTNKPFTGRYQLKKHGKLVAEDSITIAPRKTWTRLHEQALQPNAINYSGLSIELTADGKTEPAVLRLPQDAMAWPKRQTPITLTGNQLEWQSAFHMAMSTTPYYRLPFAPAGEAANKYWKNRIPWKDDDDFSATMYATWDEQALYLAFAVKDDVFHANPNLKQAWNGDSIQLYFDSWADARQHREESYGPDDQSFIVWPNPATPGVGTVIRDHPPEKQLAFLDAGPVKNARSTVTRKDGVTFYELALPLRDLNPIQQLKEGTIFGFTPLINDDDGDYRKSGLKLYERGVEPNGRPDLYPAVILGPYISAAAVQTIHVSPAGDDAAEGSFGHPFATFERAEKAVAALNSSAAAEPIERVEVLFGGGIYPLDKPVVIRPDQGGTAAYPVIYRASGDTPPVFTGGRTITGWTVGTNGAWTVQLPEVKAGTWNFAQLFVNGTRRFRPRLPKQDYFTTTNDFEASEQGINGFYYQEDGLDPNWANLSDIEFHTLHIWSASRVRPRSIDAQKKIVHFLKTRKYNKYWGSYKGPGWGEKGCRFWAENVKEAFGAPGEWYLDRPTGILSYMPMGGVYTLGISPGTTVHDNRIHDISAFTYGGWGLYADQGSSYIHLYNNLVYNTKTGGFDQNFGRENIVENNIFANALKDQVSRSNDEDHMSFFFRNNIVYWNNDGPLFGGNWKSGTRGLKDGKPTQHYELGPNLYWQTAGKQELFPGKQTMAQWQADNAQDAGSLVADPLFENPTANNFCLKPGSPAGKIGFKPFDAYSAGPCEPDRLPKFAIHPVPTMYEIKSN